MLAIEEIPEDNLYMQEQMVLEIRKDSANNPENVYGRTFETNKLVNILLEGAGSLSLISGDRGSGKTSTIRLAAKTVKRIRFHNRGRKYLFLGYLLVWTRKYVVQVDVPLVPNNIEVTELRSNTLRLIVQSLVSEYNSLNIFSRAKYPVGYSRYLREIEQILKYKSISRTTERSVGAQYNNSLKAKLGEQMNYEFNMAYADIELKLKEFFTRFSKHLNFVIIFDELDKYLEEEKGSESKDFKPHHYIKELKNLFTITQAKFIFTSTEDYYQEINENLFNNISRLNEYKFNLFTHKILINQLDPDSYDEFLKNLICWDNRPRKVLAKTEYELFYNQMLWYSKGYPFATLKKISELADYDHLGNSYIDLLSVNQEFATFNTHAPSLQYVLNDVYDRYNFKNDNLNRYLYKSLNKVAEVLYTRIEVPINKSNFYELIFTGLDFDPIASRESDLQMEFSEVRQHDFSSNNAGRWEVRLDQLDSGVRKTISEAVTEFIWVLDGTEIITSSPNESISMIILSLRPYSDNDFEKLTKHIPPQKTLINDDLPTLYKLGIEDRKLSARLMKIRKYAINVISSTGLNLELPITVSQPGPGGKSSSGVEYDLGWHLQSNVLHEIEEIKEFNLSLPQAVNKKLMDAISTAFRYDFTNFQEFRQDRAFFNVTLTANVWSTTIGKVIIIINPSKKFIEKTVDDKKYDKAIVVLQPNTKANNYVVNKKRIKYFNFSEGYRNYDSVLEEIKTYLTAK